jgi:hypothetical protein
VVLIVIDAATQTWAAVVGCPGSALTGQYQLRQPGDLEMGYSHLEDAQCRIVDTHRSIWFDTITSEVFEGCIGEEVSLRAGIEAVRLLNEGAPMPLNISEIHEDLLWDEMLNEQEDGA